MFFVHHRQANAQALRVALQLAVFFPAVQGGQGVELAFDRPVRANHRVGAAHQPNAHHALQCIDPDLTVGHLLASVQQLSPKAFFRV